MKIVDIEAIPTSFPIPKGRRVRLGVGEAVKKDAVVVKIRTESGLVGWGEAHHARAPGAIAQIINATLRPALIGRSADQSIRLWTSMYNLQVGSHGTGAAGACAISGVDMALWDIRAKALGIPLFRLLGGHRRPLPSYAGGVALGYMHAQDLAQEVANLTAQGFKAVKLRLGESIEMDTARVQTVRKQFPDLCILTDANAQLTVSEARLLMPRLQEYGVGWLEEPFSSLADNMYRQLRGAEVAIAAGENHYTRYDFHRLVAESVVTIMQPDLSKVGGITEALRVSSIAGAAGFEVAPHTSMTGINMAATLHYLSSIDNASYYEADVSVANIFRDRLVQSDFLRVDNDGNFMVGEAVGIGVDVDESFLRAHPVIEGPCYV